MPSAARTSRKRALCGLQRQIGFRHEGFDAIDQLMDARQRLAADALIVFVGGRLARGEGGVGVAVACRDRGIDRQPAADIGPLAADDRHLPACGWEVLQRGGARRLVGQLQHPAAAPFGVRPLGVTPLARAGRLFEALRQLRVLLRIVERGHAFPFRAGDLHRIECGVGARLLEALAERGARTDRGAALFCGFGRLGLTPVALERVRRLTIARLLLRTLGVRRVDRWRRRHIRRTRGRRAGVKRLLCGTLVHLAQQPARALDRVLALRARRDLLEIRPIGEPLDGGRRGVLELAVGRHAQQLAAILQLLERIAPDRLERRVPRDRPERVRIGDALQREPRDRFPGRALGDRGQCPQIVHRLDGRDAFRFAGPLEGFQRDVAQHRRRLRADALVRVAARRRGEQRRIHQLGDGRAPHARILIVARKGRQRLALVHRKLLDEGQTHCGIGIGVAGRRAESIEQCHEQRSSLAPNGEQLVAAPEPDPNRPVLQRLGYLQLTQL